jgi:radical SAM superfamily enzyme YgiQ (UPF0313 family)
MLPVEAPTGSAVKKRLRICLINPKFEPSYWGFDYALPLYPGKVACTMATGALPHLAALTPDHDVTLLDENVEEIDFAALSRFDVVGVTGMNVQKQRMREVLEVLRSCGIFTAVGGAYASVDEAYFDELCDVLFSGEADETWPQFIADFAEGKPYERWYKQQEMTDMSRLPIPRFDLLKVNRYASGAVQFSRGCPFLCEFCDIIVTFGRRPRTKRPAQLVEELEEMRKAGFFSCFIVDDNFIGNKKAAKELLRLIISWQQQHGYPLRLMTEASVNLADDAELLDLLYQANFRSVFIGIETPQVESLKETKKFQNTKGDKLEAKLARIQNAGLDISAGFIVGFDNDDESIFERQYQFIQDNGVLLAMVGMLTAVPKTPLYDRLDKEGRLKLDDTNCNIIPKQMTPSQLRDGYWRLLQQLYAPEAFLERYFMTCRNPEYIRRRTEITKRTNRDKTLRTVIYGMILTWNLFWTLIKERRFKAVGFVYAKYLFTHSFFYQRNIGGIVQFVNRCVAHWHFYKFTSEATAGKIRLYNSG